MSFEYKSKKEIEKVSSEIYKILKKEGDEKDKFFKASRTLDKFYEECLTPAIKRDLSKREKESAIKFKKDYYKAEDVEKLKDYKKGIPKKTITIEELFKYYARTGNITEKTEELTQKIIREKIEKLSEDIKNYDELLNKGIKKGEGLDYKMNRMELAKKFDDIRKKHKK